MAGDDRIAQLRTLPEFAESPYAFVSPEGAIDFHRRKHVLNLKQHCDISQAVMLDCGCGYGWNVLAYLLEGGQAAIGLDCDPAGLRAAAAMARSLGVHQRALFLHGSVTDLPVGDLAVDVSMSIETLEHLYGGADRAIAEMRRVSRSVVLITTPNKLFPVIAHDTRLPFAHWLPPGIRRGYSWLLGRAQDDAGNQFVTPFQIRRGLRGFELVSRFLGFDSFAAYRKFYPHYLPYSGGGCTRDWPRGQGLVYAIIHSILGRRSFYAAPSLAGIFRRRKGTSALSTARQST